MLTRPPQHRAAQRKDGEKPMAKDAPGYRATAAAASRIDIRDRYGDWGRDVALYLGRQRCYSLPE
jgi:hypothetical protein